MRRLRWTTPPPMPPPSGFTMLELVVAMVVLGVALTGLVPLLAITSRQLQPVRTPEGASAYDCRSPARDWSKNADDDNSMDPLQPNQRHDWYLIPYNDPWVRKLGAAAQVLPKVSSDPPTTTPAAARPAFPLQPVTAFFQDNFDTAPLPGDGNGSGTFTKSSLMEYVSPDPPTGHGGDYHRMAATGQDQPNVAAWTLTVPAEGWYSIQATWPTNTGLALANAVYAVSGTASGTTTTPINQASPGNDYGNASGSGNASRWWPLASLYLHAGEQVTVRLSVPGTSANDTYVLADAVQAVQNQVGIESVERSFGRKNADGTPQPDVTAQVSVTVSTTP